MERLSTGAAQVQKDRFMRNPFLSRGRPLAVYFGTGELRLRDGTQVACIFEAAQLRDTTIALRCYDAGRHDFDPSIADRFEGVTDDGQPITLSGRDGLRWQIDVDRRHRHPVQDASIVFYLCDRLVFNRIRTSDAPPAYAVYGLTNLMMTAREGADVAYRPSKGRHVRFVLVKDGNDTINIIFRPLPRIKSRHLSVRALRAIDVTVELILRIDSLDGLDYLNGIARDCSDLLSFASGTPITIAYRELTDDDGTIREVQHFSGFAKRYVPYPVVDYRSTRNTLRFLSGSFPVYRKLSSALNLRQIIRTLSDARQAEDYLQVRGVKIVAAAEMLKSSFVASKLLSISENIIPSDRFSEVVSPRLERELIAVQNEGGIDSETRVTFTRKLREINRISFQEILAGICKYVRLDVDSELQSFVASRNRLIHTGHFLSESTRREDRRRVRRAGWQSTMQEYAFLVDVIDRIMLRLLNYEGGYVDNMTWPELSSKRVVATRQPRRCEQGG
jgi:hypothetical protein